MKILGIIPSRYASTRFPGKPLVEIAGKSMIQRVYEQARKAKELSEVIVATDDKRIFDHVISFGGKVIMTSSKHQSGTDRCIEVVQKLDTNYDYVINIQGDEPFIHPQQIKDLATSIQSNKFKIVTLAKKIKDELSLFNPNIVKVIFNHNNKAIYFSRQTIPFIKGKDQTKWLSQHNFYKHIGLYAFKTTTLLNINRLNDASLESAEGLEQLKWLQNGIDIGISLTELETIGIDIPEDIEKLQEKGLI